MQQATHAWNRTTPKLSGAMMRASAAVGTNPRKHRLVSLVNITYDCIRIHEKTDEKPTQLIYPIKDEYEGTEKYVG